MQNNIFSKVNVSTRILSLVLLTLSILIAKSVYLIIFLSILSIMLIMLTNKSVKLYIDLLKNVKFWLLFIFITYIIIFRNITNIFVFIYKIILMVLIVKQFSLTVNFSSFTNGVRTLLNIFSKTFNLNKISYDIAIFIYFISIYFNSKKEIFINYDTNQKLKYMFSLKYNFIPRVFLSMSKINKLESSLKLKFYTPKIEEKNTNSNVVLFTFCLLFIVIVFKEVIL